MTPPSGSISASDTGTDGNDADPRNDLETAIGVDMVPDQPDVQLVNTMQNKLQLLTNGAEKPARATTAKEQVLTAAVAAQEQCNRVVVDLQDVA